MQLTITRIHSSLPLEPEDQLEWLKKFLAAAAQVIHEHHAECVGPFLLFAWLCAS